MINKPDGAATGKGSMPVGASASLEGSLHAEGVSAGVPSCRRRRGPQGRGVDGAALAGFRVFGISKCRLARWLKIADREDGLTRPAAGDRGDGERKSAALREQRRRNKLLEENEILRRATAYFARDVLPK